MGSMGAVIIMKAAVIILAFVAAASAVTYKGTQTIKVGKKSYKCTFNIQYSTDPATCKKKTVKYKPGLKKNSKFTIEHNGATISGTTAKNKISSCNVASTAPPTEAPPTPAAPTEGPTEGPTVAPTEGPAPGSTGWQDLSDQDAQECLGQAGPSGQYPG